MISKELQIVGVPFSYQQIKVMLLYRANINTPINYNELSQYIMLIGKISLISKHTNPHLSILGFT